MKNKTLFCIGYGYVAKTLATRLGAEGWRAAGTTRHDDKIPALERDGVGAHLWKPGDFNPAWLDGAEALLISTPPEDDGCPAFLQASQAIADRRKDIEWIGYLSTNGVYGDHDGAWVDETSALKPTTDRAKRRVRAEKAWLELAAQKDLPLTVFRLPGIYGPGRSVIDSVRAGIAKRIYKKGQVFSRMHVNDIASALIASMIAPGEHNLYNLADDEPAPPQDVIEYACALLGAEPPPLVPIEKADLSPMARSFYTDNKRVSNKRMKGALLPALSYPTYREGLKAVFDAAN